MTDAVDHSSRRAVLVGAAGVAGMAGVLAACGGGSGGSSGGGYGGAPDSGSTEGGGAGEALAQTSEIPVGGGRVFDGQKVVVTQPEEGDFKAFSAVCTHRGCTVDSVADGVIACPCHGSRYSITDGSVQGGPAPKPLPTENISVEGETIRLA
ncbi:MAG: Rieske 2Fe-2S domain-containing protein [Streptosporangiales bacterium]|nr:Rieske 2Fe-2S domain-containing protein [Streptosporangiales bacterium]